MAIPIVESISTPLYARYLSILNYQQVRVKAAGAYNQMLIFFAISRYPVFYFAARVCAPQLGISDENRFTWLGQIGG